MLTLMAHLDSSADAVAWKKPRGHVEKRGKKHKFTDAKGKNAE